MKIVYWNILYVTIVNWKLFGHGKLSYGFDTLIKLALSNKITISIVELNDFLSKIYKVHELFTIFISEIDINLIIAFYLAIKLK